MSKNEPNMTVYKIARFLSAIISKTVFKTKIVRNEIKDKKGPMVIIGNHQAALDFTTLIGATKEHMTFVVSDSFYNTLPFKKAMDEIGVISKQQFQTSVKEVIAMKRTVTNNGILMFYPAGLMSEDGIDTPLPMHTHEFIKRLDADVYAARIYGSYLCTPKWSSKIRPGKTYLDIYKIIDKEDFATLTDEEINEIIHKSLDFDAYHEQERYKTKYRHGDNIKGLENVLYVCPHCKKEFTIKAKSKNTLYCTECGFAHASDKYGFLHNVGTTDEEFRYVSDWSRLVQEKIKGDIESGNLSELSCRATIQTINHKRHKYEKCGCANVTLTPEKFIISGAINCKYQKIEVPLTHFASLPFKPGCRIEIQQNKTTYRCVLDDGKLATKFVHAVEIFNQKQ